MQNKNRTTDLSGIGAFMAGGRWNSKGTCMLYTSEYRSLAYLESLVHFDRFSMPPRLFIMVLDINARTPIYTLPAASYPAGWQKPGLISNQQPGDRWMKSMQGIAVKIRSAINPSEFNYLLNPLFPRFHDLVKVMSAVEIMTEGRL
ncbi:MAG: RES family NAD+ phosphorylase [Ferruginibacter sp.]